MISSSSKAKDKIITHYTSMSFISIYSIDIKELNIDKVDEYIKDSRITLKFDSLRVSINIFSYNAGSKSNPMNIYIKFLDNEEEDINKYLKLYKTLHKSDYDFKYYLKRNYSFNEINFYKTFISLKLFDKNGKLLKI